MTLLSIFGRLTIETARFYILQFAWRTDSCHPTQQEHRNTMPLKRGFMIQCPRSIAMTSQRNTFQHGDASCRSSNSFTDRPMFFAENVAISTQCPFVLLVFRCHSIPLFQTRSKIDMFGEAMNEVAFIPTCAPRS